ncbi:hypothetical protein SESBI_07943 [Sesbania bispinosa]|nr:hypothetical protein SESBI_07943 [Sesbania bispinosa]
MATATGVDNRCDATIVVVGIVGDGEAVGSKRSTVAETSPVMGGDPDTVIVLPLVLETMIEGEVPVKAKKARG